jgi:alcohol dehydrogenase class IV
MNSFSYYFPTRIIFGIGKFDTIGEEVAALGKRAMIATYSNNSLAEYVERAVELLKRNGVTSFIFNEVTANPDRVLVNKGGELARKEKCDVIIGLGGGSAMDVAKAIAIIAVENVDIWKIYEGKPITQTPLPMVAVPTTAGTGSEATQFVVMSDHTIHRKEGFARPQFYPRLSILDPLLTVKLPPEITAATGMDALTHAIEAYTCRAATHATDVYAVEAIRLIPQYLHQAVYFGDNLEARSNMLWANSLAGMAISQSDSSLAHVIGEAVGAVYDTAHGLSVSLALPAVMEYNCVANISKYAHITRLMGEGAGCLTDREAALKSASVIRNLIKDLGMPQGLAALGVSDLTEVMALVNRPGTDCSSPRPADSEAYDKLVKGSMSPMMSYWAFDNELDV